MYRKATEKVNNIPFVAENLWKSAYIILSTAFHSLFSPDKSKSLPSGGADEFDKLVEDLPPEDCDELLLKREDEDGFW